MRNPRRPSWLSSKRTSSNRNGRLAPLALALAALLAQPAAAPLAQSAPDPADAAQAAPAGAADQEQPEPRAGFTETVETELALIEVVVLDKRGRHVRGLPASFFTLKERGQEVPLVTFDEIDLAVDSPQADRARDAEAEAAAAQVAAEAEAQAERAAADRAAAERDEAARRAAAEIEERLRARRAGQRWFVLAFDGYNNVSPLRLSQGRRAAKKWVDENMRPGDMAAVFELTPFLRSVSGFTNNRETLKDAIDEVRMFPGQNMGTELIEQRLESGDIVSRDVLQRQLLNAAEFAGDLLARERDQYYGNVRNLSEVLASFEGTRAILMFSGGFPVTRSRSTTASGGFTVRFKRMLEQLDRDGVRVFTFDTGEDNFFTDVTKETNSRVRLDDLGLGTEWLDDLQIGAQVTGANAHQEILYVLGNETGGRFWGGRDYETGLRAADDDLSHYYLIGYQPTPAQKASRIYVPIKVDTEERGYEVIARRGRFEEGRSRADEELIAAGAQRTANEEARRAAEAARPLQVQCRPTLYPGPGYALAVLPIRIGGPLEPVGGAAGSGSLEFEIGVGAAQGGTEIGSTVRRVSLDVDSARADLLRGGVHLRDAIVVPSGAVEFEVRVRQTGAGRSGVWKATVEVPQQDPATFGIAGLTLLDPSDSAPLVFDVFAKDEAIPGAPEGAALPDPLGSEAGAGRPNSLLRGRFPRGVPLLAQVHVLSPPSPSPDAETPLRMDWELIPENGGEALAPPVTYRRVRPDPDGNFLDVILSLDLKSVEPGAYTLRLTAVNLIDASSATGSYDLTLTP